MGTVDEQIRSAASAISSNITSLGHDRALLAQNILSQLRNLVEGVMVRVHAGRGDVEFQYSSVKPASAHVSADAKVNFLSRFHKLLQISASHYTMGGDPSERLMLKYYDYLHQIRDLARTHLSLNILQNLEDFPIDLDPSLREYHEKIADRLMAARSLPLDQVSKARYYIHAVRPFYAGGHIYYEVTFYNAVNRVSKFDRIIGFTDIEITDKHAANLTLASDSIRVLGQTMPITIIREWEVSIRPCEFDNFARIFGQYINVSSGSSEYRNLALYLTTTSSSLLDLVDATDDQYSQVKAWATQRSKQPLIFPVLDMARRMIQSKSAGYNVLRYLMLRMNNQIIKLQYAPTTCGVLSNLHLEYGCKPFDEMPFCTSLYGHNPRIADLFESLDISGRTHEFLARRVKTNVENHGMLYTPVRDLEDLGDIDRLIATYNGKLYYKHTARKLLKDKGQVFLKGYEDGTVEIIEKFQELATTGIAGYEAAVKQWLAQATPPSDDPIKVQALQKLFADSRVALIYGAAGTGKSTMVGLIANYFNGNEKLFLAHTNPAVDNLKRRVNAQKSTFRTISSQIGRYDATEYDVLVIDECSTVSNSDLLKVLERTSFKLLVLVGDVFQIQSIQFGNWFGLSRSFIPSTAVFELETPFRTTNANLLDLWSTVRDLKDDIAETLARNGYATVLDKSLFAAQRDDEIILCLNYDGLYGINNVNRFLQSSNPGVATVWGASTYKVGDPVLFNETDRFKPVIFNNLKGKIVAIQTFPGRIRFDVSLDRPVTAFDVDGVHLRYVQDSTVQFDVYELGSGDYDDDSTTGSVPFQVAYAVSIHKAQGLEYDSVKVVITDANEDDISHNIFYTAITRAREHLQIFWTPETEHAVLSSLQRSARKKDVALLASRRGLTQTP
ncbi:AAA family ATPase [Streptomyces sp. SID9913]|uniref:ATP-dependent DNA helicase n=1 Tax=Streptomyces sp. SID9913 TaxID=2706117 RepID=UPI0013DC704E|nr:ATP-dependent RecD-like DNA helicase [Streptomyces sp. SID9913]NED20443.1 AAA family ATPase [Streptomyces sp. SID9913]NED21107.1 AAA family ATPase [Streptomyces sp. SID9913]